MPLGMVNRMSLSTGFLCAQVNGLMSITGAIYDQLYASPLTSFDVLTSWHSTHCAGKDGTLSTAANCSSQLASHTCTLVPVNIPC